MVQLTKRLLENPAVLGVSLVFGKEEVPAAHRRMKEAGVDEQWLKQELKKKNIDKTEDVLFAEWHKNKPLYTVTYEQSRST